MKNTVINTLTIATLIFLGMTFNTVEAAPKNCKSKYVSEVGSASGEVEIIREKKAKNKAAEAWQEKVAERHSSHYSDFKNAYNPFFSCRTNAFGGTTCIVTALPCNNS